MLSAGYYEYFNEELEFSGRLYEGYSEQSEEEHDISLITMVEKAKCNYRSVWEGEGEIESKEAEQENSEEEINTYRLSNPCTPIQDLEKIPDDLSPSFFDNDSKKKHIINNLFYGNYSEKFNARQILPMGCEKSDRSRDILISNLLNQSKDDKLK
uniref:Uncharacterized protein n=1 Tax=Euplotes harpa TaxID=151035 RepID=A0A7S3J8V7_9SPIT|mmetsp:Transcript_23264/g.26668  ORF Transcript_23264/g.26668 Transcript_23264/m.26668 type:complete len:155 (+) Transcript_23264:295-759(+)